VTVMHEDILEAVESVLEVTGPIYSLADLAAGSGEIADLVDIDASSKYLGDGQPGYDHQGSVDELLPDIPYVHLFVLNGQIRGLNDPLATLYKIRAKAAYVLIVDWIDEQWDTVRLTEALSTTGLQPYAEMPVEIPDGKFHVWLCKNQFFSQPDNEV
jgi:hypothetical protein